MRVKLEVNEVSPESWVKDGKEFTALRLLCVDKDPNAAVRFKEQIVIGVSASQKEFVAMHVKRDTRIEVDLTGTRYVGQTLMFEGEIIPESVPRDAGKVDRPAAGSTSARGGSNS